MKILFALTYYRPHISGLTVYVQRLAEALATRGHQVTVLTSRHNSALPLDETMNGVRIVRVPVAFSISKGAIMPSYPAIALRLIREHDVVAGNLPNTPIEALCLAPLARLVARRPATMTYHCDVQLPAGLFNRLVDELVFLSNNVAALLANRVVAYTTDYATHSRLLRRYPRKRVVIPPPVEIPAPTAAQVEAFRRRHNLYDKRVIGFVARFATEKGIEYALHAIPHILAAEPNAVVLFAGEYKHVIGEEEYWARLQPELQQYAAHWQFVGVLSPTDPAELASFYVACDVTILPSINSTESFGLVQVESMLCGTPVVASNLPGVRQPVTVTGMGRIVPIKDPAALAEAVIDVLGHPERYVRPRAEIEALYSTARTAEAYESLFDHLVGQKARRGARFRGPRARAALAGALMVTLLAARHVMAQRRLRYKDTRTAVPSNTRGWAEKMRVLVVQRLGMTIAPFIFYRLAGAHRLGRVSQQLVAQLYWLWLRWRGDTSPRIVEGLVRGGDVVVDIGGAWGAYAYQFARRVGPRGRVYVFEPHPANQDSLQAIRAGRSNITIYATALSDHTGEAELHIPTVRGHQLTNLSSLATPDDTSSVMHDAVPVQVERLDAILLPGGPAVTFMKCDVEGHELVVLRGAEQTLRRSLPALLIEIEQRHKQESIQETFDYLTGLGYAGYSLHPDGLRPLNLFDVQRDQLAFLDLDFTYGVPSGYVNDFLFVRPGTDVTRLSRPMAVV